MYEHKFRGGSLRFGPAVTPPVIRWILLANVLVYLIQINRIDGLFQLALIPGLVWQAGWIWQPFTYMWLHDPFGLSHILLNMLMLWMFGSTLAVAWGWRAFLRFYLLCGIGAGVIIAVVFAIPVALGLAVPLSYGIPTLGASGAIFGVLLAYSLTWPRNVIILLIPPIPIRAIFFIPVIFLVGWLFGPDDVSHVGHLAGVLVAWILFRRRQRLSLLPNLGGLRQRWKLWRSRRRFRIIRDDE